MDFVTPPRQLLLTIDLPLLAHLGVFKGEMGGGTILLNLGILIFFFFYIYFFFHFLNVVGYKRSPRWCGRLLGDLGGGGGGAEVPLP